MAHTYYYLVYNKDDMLRDNTITSFDSDSTEEFTAYYCGQTHHPIRSCDVIKRFYNLKECLAFLENEKENTAK